MPQSFCTCLLSSVWALCGHISWLNNYFWVVNGKGLYIWTDNNKDIFTLVTKCRTSIYAISNILADFGQIRWLTSSFVSPWILWLPTSLLLCVICWFYWDFLIMHLWPNSCVFALCFCLLSHKAYITMDHLKVQIYLNTTRDCFFLDFLIGCKLRGGWMVVSSHFTQGHHK